MKRLFFFTLIFIFLLCSCSISSNTKNSISTYFPFYKNKTYIYKMTDSSEPNEKVITEVFPLYIKNNKVQLIERVVNYDSSSKETDTDIYNEFYWKMDGKLAWFTIADLIENPFLNHTEDDMEREYILFSDPLEIGDFSGPDDGDRPTITDLNKRIKTEYGIFTGVMEVTTSTSYSEYRDYYAPGVGLIKRIWKYKDYKDEEFPGTKELSNIIENSSFDIERTLYTVDYNAKKLLESNFTIKLFTNDNLADKILDVMKENNLVTNNAKINKLKIEYDKYSKTDILYIDFNKGFIDLSKLGASNESLTLRAIANTFAHVYDQEEGSKIEKVNITVDGKKYESGNISLKDKIR